MPDLRVPGVYVFIEDRSRVEPVLESGRSGYVVIASDRGPHNRIVKITNWDEFVETFGEPDIEKTGPGHYLAYAFLMYSQKLFVCRVVPDPANGFEEEESATLANGILAKNDQVETLSGTYSFRVDKDKSLVESSSPDQTLVKAFIAKGDVTSFDSLAYAQEVKQVLTDGYRLAADYQGTSGYGSIKVVEVQSTLDAGTGNQFEFVEYNGTPRKALTCTDPNMLNNFRIGDLVLGVSADGTTVDGRQYAVRIIARDGNYLVLDEPYNGTNIASQYVARIRQWADAVDSTGNRIQGYKFSKGSKVVICKDQTAFDVFVDRANNQLRSNYFWVFKAGADSWGDGIDKALKIVKFEYDDDAGIYRLYLEEPYEGTSTSLLGWDYIGIVGGGDAQTLQVSANVTIDAADVVVAADANAKFYGSDWDPKIVVCGDAASYDAVSEGDWIAAQADGVEYARQVVKKYTTDGRYYLYLDEPYTGQEVTGPAIKVVPVIHVSKPFVNREEEFDPNDPNVLFYFYAVGAGSWYNNIRIRAYRNTEYEKMYTDENGDPLYKYFFWDIYVYRVGDDGNYTEIEGPFTVSLAPYVYFEGKKVNVRDIYSGKSMYIETVINERSKHIRCKAGSLNVDEIVKNEKLRFQTLLTMTNATPAGTSNIPTSQELAFKEGSDGILYLSNGLLNLGDEKVIGLFAKAYEGSLVSVDGSVELIRQATYPWYEFDYVLVGGYPIPVQNAAASLADVRRDLLVLGDTGFNWSAEQDIDARLNDTPYNSWSVALYTQYRKIFDKFTGKEIWVTPVYHAIQRHLYVDEVYGITEPVAGIEKGNIPEKIELAYRPNLVQIGDLIEKQLNPTIVEPDGKYFIQQYTTWKRLSKLKYQNIAKFVHYLKKMIPKLLKDIVQRKSTPTWVNEAKIRVTDFMKNFLYNPANERWSILQSFKVAVDADQESGTLYVTLSIVPYGVIERIVVNIPVY